MTKMKDETETKGEGTGIIRETEEKSPVGLAEGFQHLPEHLNVRRVLVDTLAILCVALQRRDVDLGTAADTALELLPCHEPQ